MAANSLEELRTTALRAFPDAFILGKPRDPPLLQQGCGVVRPNRE